MRTTWLALGGLFLANGLLFSSWITHIPGVQTRLGLPAWQVGLSLTAVTLGAVAVLPLAARFMARRSTRLLISLGLTVEAAALLLAMTTSTATLLPLYLLLVGAGFGLVDYVLNVLAVQHEQRTRRPLLSGLHGLYSAGALLGAVAGGLALTARLAAPHHVAGVIVVAALPLLWTRALPAIEVPAPEVRSNPAGSAGSTGPRPGLLLSLLVFTGCAAIAEGAVGDWAGIYLHTAVQVPLERTAWGFTAFSLTMMIGRLVGDRLRARWSAAVSGALAGCLTAAGLSLALLVPYLAAGVTGFALMGLGLSLLAPLAFSVAGQAADTGAMRAVAWVSAVFQGGFLLGPPLIGLLSLTSLRLALWLVVLLALLAALLAARFNSAGSPNAADPEWSLR